MADNKVEFNIKFVFDTKVFNIITQNFGNIDKSVHNVNNSFHTVNNTVQQTAGSIANAAGQSKGFLDGFNKLGGIMTSFNNIYNTISTVVGKMKEFTDANNAQQEAEAKLAQVMRNTMGATDAEIESIKQLASAQQALGVIGDEVQLSGAQELGTYLEKADSLKALMPVMNNMLAQQYGLNATQEQAVTIGSMMGKVMEGQTEALARYGYKFDEAQAHMLKFGTEEQRVATLADVINQSVGGVNEALAATPEGKLKQVSNNMGDIKERVGKLWTDLSAKLVPLFDRLINLANGIIDIVSQGWPVWVAAGAAAVIAVSKVKASLTGVMATLAGTTAGAFTTGGAFTVMGTLGKIACRGISTAITSIPIVGWIAGAITLVIGLFTTLWNKCEGFRMLVCGVWEVIKSVFATAWQYVSTLFQNIYNSVATVLQSIAKVFSTVYHWISDNVLQPLWNFFGGFADFVKGIVDKVIGWLAEAFQPIIDLWNKLTGKASETYKKGAQKGSESYKKDKAAKSAAPSPYGLTADAAMPSPQATPPAKATQQTEATATGGTRNTQITINLGKMVENIVFNGTLGDNEENLQRQVEETLLRTLYAAQSAAL